MIIIVKITITITIYNIVIVGDVVVIAVLIFTSSNSISEILYRKIL